MSSLPGPQRESQPLQPDLYTLAERIYNLGDFLLWDDRFDIGYGVYNNRPHMYGGKLEKDHPSPWHHWPIGIFAMALGQFLGTVATLNDMQNGIQSEQQEQTFNTNVQ